MFTDCVMQRAFCELPDLLRGGIRRREGALVDQRRPLPGVASDRQEPA
jgi:hypothetical protein